MRRLTFLTAAMFVCVGLFGQQYDAETMAKVRAEKQATALEQAKNTKQQKVKASKNEILMQNGTVTTCSATFYDTGGATGSYQNNENLTLTLLPATSGAQIMVTFTAFNVENNWDFLKIYNGTSASAPQLANLTGTTIPAQPYIASNAQGALTFVFTSDGSVTAAGWSATVACFMQVENNLSAMGLAGTAFGTVGVEKTMNVVVKNMGTSAVAEGAYTVQLVDNNSNVLGTTSGVAIASNEQLNVPVSFVPSAQGTIQVKGKIVFAADQDMANNETSLMSISIMAAGTHVAQIGTATTFPPSKIPFDFYFKNSAAQTIYYPAELGIGGGLITGVSYQANFVTDLSAGKPVKIWIGETTETNMTAGWIAPASLTLVYDGNVNIPTGSSTLYIPFATPYVYGGGNLVIYTNRVFEDVYYNTNDRFHGTEFANSSRTRRLSTDTQFDPAAPGAGSVIHWAPNTTLFFSTAGLGALQGTVTSNSSPLSSVGVKLLGTNSNATTNAAGFYNFPFLIAGTFDVQYTKHGFETFVAEDVAIVGDETTVVDVTLTPIMTYMVSGTVTASDTQLGVEGAVVTLEGYSNYTATTNANGHYSISGVYGAGREYAVKVEYTGYSTYNGTVTVNDAHITNLDIIVEEVAYPAVSVNAEVTAQENALVTWMAPGTLMPVEFRYDSGIQSGQLGSGTGTNNTVLGAVHRVNAQIHEVAWYTTAEGGPHNTINVFLFALNTSGAPTNTVLYSQMAVANVDNQWNTLVLPTPIDAPNGFYLAISYAGFVAIGTTIPNAEWPLVPNTQCFSMDYTAGSFSYVETLSAELRNNFMVRAYGYNMGKSAAQGFAYTKTGANSSELQLITNNPVETGTPTYTFDGSSSKVFLNYSVFRLLEGQPANNWVQVGTAVADTFFVDNTWSGVAPGMYQYAVVANYTNGVASPAALSNVLAKAMEVPFTVNITTNSGDAATGAVVNLVNIDGVPAHAYTATAGAAGVTFPTVWRGTYNMTITKTGFNPYSATNIVINEAGSHTAQLIETILEPFGLIAVQDGANANFSWNNATGFSDDIESYENFLIANIGNYTMVDVDGKTTYTITNVTFPNQGYTGSYIVFNPSATTPALTTEDWQPHSGSKYLACFAATSTPWNNDWLIAPQVTVTPGMQISFWAKSVTAEYGLERFKVGVSTTGTAPANFTTFLTGATFVQAPTTWTQYTYSLSAFVGQTIYIGIQCVSQDAFVFMVDDIAIGQPKDEAKAFSGYTVYLDGEQQAAGIQGTNYVFQNVPLGEHTAGVKAVYTSGQSTTQTVVFNMVVPTYTVTFNVRRASNNAAIAAANIVINSESLTTNTQGVATITLPAGSYDYVVTKAGFAMVVDQVDVAGNMTVNVLMTGIEEAVATHNVVLYPNPVADMLTIVRANTTTAMVEIFADNGTMVKAFEMNDAQKEISVSDLNSGVYFVRIIENQNTTVQRFIKK